MLLGAGASECRWAAAETIARVGTGWCCHILQLCQAVAAAHQRCLPQAGQVRRGDVRHLRAVVQEVHQERGGLPAAVHTRGGCGRRSFQGGYDICWLQSLATPCLVARSAPLL